MKFRYKTAKALWEREKDSEFRKYLTDMGKLIKHINWMEENGR